MDMDGIKKYEKHLKEIKIIKNKWIIILYNNINKILIF